MNIANHLNIAIVCSVLLVPLAAEAEPSILSRKPETRAIETFLLAKGNRKLIEETRGTEGGTYDDAYGKFDLLTGPVSARKKIRFHVFKEAGQWVAYDKLPTHKDSLYVFVELATDYLTKKKGEGWHITAANPEPKATSKSIP